MRSTSCASPTARSPTAATLVRADPIVDAGLGYVDVIADRLQRVEVKHGAAPASGTTRTYTDIAARYEFDVRARTVRQVAADAR